MNSSVTVLQTSFPDLKLLRRGKVRDVYEVDENHLLIVATDRLSAFDCVLPTPIKRKGEVLTALSKFWFEKLSHISPNHLITTEIEEMPDVVKQYDSDLRGRSMFVTRTEVFPVECVVRGYLSGSGWKDYLATGEICGHHLPQGLLESAQLPTPIFTPATKAESGHDENISEDRVKELLGSEITNHLRETALGLYKEASNYALECGIIIADTKFELGKDKTGKIILVDEALTPDSSRFWPADKYEAGKPQPSFDKQFVRDYLETLDWNKQPPAPALPDEIAEATTARYLEAHKLLTKRNL